jgi:hypothetical protein
MKRAFIFPFFLILNIFVSISTLAVGDVNLEIPTVENDVTIVDEYRGTVNSSHPLYWGNYSYFLSADLVGIFFVQKGGVHNHATHHTVWNETVYITKVTNCEFIDGQVIAHNNETHVFFSDGSDRWISDRVCPLCVACMHGYEFSPYSKAIYWQCSNCRLIMGEIL